MVTSELTVNTESVAVSRKIYTPVALKVAVVPDRDALPNVTVPGPVTTDQSVLNVLPAGRPSSVAVPASVTVVTGRKIV